jgi:hypothetical protein
MARFAEAWSEYLPENHRKALYDALCILSDWFFEDKLDDEEHIFRQLLPAKYFHQYTPGFLKNFYTVFLTVGYKLALPEEGEMLACTAEELALHILIEEATALLEIDGINAEFNEFEDVIYQDWDFEYLYDLEVDGIEDGKTGAELGIVNLRFSEWFKPFVNASFPVHPLCQD